MIILIKRSVLLLLIFENYQTMRNSFRKTFNANGSEKVLSVFEMLLSRYKKINYLYSKSNHIRMVGNLDKKVNNDLEAIL